MLSLDVEDTRIDFANFGETNLVEFVEKSDENDSRWMNFPWSEYFKSSDKIAFHKLCDKRTSAQKYIECKHSLDYAFIWKSVNDGILGYCHSYWNSLSNQRMKYEDLSIKDKSFVNFVKTVQENDSNWRLHNA